MVKFTTEELQTSMYNRDNIRNISLIGHVAHGKSTLTDSLAAAVGLIAQDNVGTVRITDSRLDEQESGFSIKSTGISLYYKVAESLQDLKGENQGNGYLINLIDTPGLIDFSAEVTAGLRATDGALIVVDGVDGFSMQTQTLIRQALGEIVRPVLTINKMDRCFFELQMDGEDAYQAFRKIIENVNITISTYQEALPFDFMLCPEEGTVAFSSGLHGWAFTLSSFAKIYASKFKVDQAKLMQRLWGENFFDPATKKWTTKNTGSPTCTRGFVRLIFNPIKKIFSTCLNGDKVQLCAMLQKIGVTMMNNEKELTGKALIRRVMQAWLPASQILDMFIFHLPSPNIAQGYRVENLYSGQRHDNYAESIRYCNPDGPLILYVTKLIPTSDNRKFFAFGRVFSGMISTGMEVKIMGPDYVPGKDAKDVYSGKVQQLVVWMGKRQLKVNDVPSGNTVAILGLDQFITKNATLTNMSSEFAHTIRKMKFSVSPIVRSAVKPMVASQLPKLLDGLKRLVKSDPMVEYKIEDSGAHVIKCAGEHNLEVSLKDLHGFTGGVGIIPFDPVVSFRETVLERSSRIVMSKSPNRRNRLYMEARPMEDGLAEAIEDGRIDPSGDSTDLVRHLTQDFDWDRELAMKIWSFGPETTGPNLLVDRCRGAQYLNSIKQPIVAGFQEATKEGALCDEYMRGICFELCDVSLDPDAIYRGAGQVFPTASRVIRASQLTASPRLMEPMYMAEIQATDQSLGSVYSVLSRRGAKVVDVIPKEGTSMYTIMAHLPVVMSFGFAGELRAKTSGQAFADCVVDYWKLVQSNPLEAGSKAALLVADIRKRKGLKVEMTKLSEYED